MAFRDRPYDFAWLLALVNEYVVISSYDFSGLLALVNWAVAINPCQKCPVHTPFKLSLAMVMLCMHPPHSHGQHAAMFHCAPLPWTVCCTVLVTKPFVRLFADLVRALRLHCLLTANLPKDHVPRTHVQGRPEEVFEGDAEAPVLRDHAAVDIDDRWCTASGAHRAGYRPLQDACTGDYSL